MWAVPPVDRHVVGWSLTTAAVELLVHGGDLIRDPADGLFQLPKALAVQVVRVAPHVGVTLALSRFERAFLNTPSEVEQLGLGVTLVRRSVIAPRLRPSVNWATRLSALIGERKRFLGRSVSLDAPAIPDDRVRTVRLLKHRPTQLG
jgi:hypothetical protein